MNNKEYRAAALIKDAVDGTHSVVSNLALHAALIDNFCDNMPDGAVQYLYAGTFNVAFTVKGGPDILAHAIRFFRTRGWVLQNERPTARMAHWEGKFTHGELTNLPRVTLTFSSDVCKMVAKGKRTVTHEETIYELECSDGSTPTDDPIGDEPQAAYEGPMEPPERELPAEEP